MKLLAAFKNFRSRKARPRILDFVRRKLVVETPEEAIRQRVLRSLHFDYGYPHDTLRCEEPVQVGDAQWRADIVVRVARAVGQGGASDGYDALVELFRQLPGASHASVVPLPSHISFPIDGRTVSLALCAFFIDSQSIGLQLDATMVGPSLPYRVLARPYSVPCTDFDDAVRVAIGIPADATAPEAVAAFLRNCPDVLEGFDRLIVGVTTACVFFVVPVVGGRCVLASIARDAWDEEMAKAAEPQVEAPDQEDDDDDSKPDEDWPIVVVECKAWDVPLSQGAEWQGMNYGNAVGAQYLVVTNGREARTFHYPPGASDWSRLDELPTYDALIEDSSLGLRNRNLKTIERLLPVGIAPPGALLAWRRWYSTDAIDLTAMQAIAACRLIDCIEMPMELFEQGSLPPEWGMHDDLGSVRRRVRSTRGEYRSLYRDIAVGRTFSKANPLVGVAIARAVFQPSPNEEDLEGAPCAPLLHVGVMRTTTVEHVLEIDLATSLEIRGTRVVLAHDGSMRWKRTTADSARVLAQVREDAPWLLKDDRVLLWDADLREQVTPAHGTELFRRLIAYALVRRECADLQEAKRR